MQEPLYSRDYLLIALFTGMRRGEIARLRWENIDLVGRSLHIPKTKNGDPLDLPLSTTLSTCSQNGSAWLESQNGCFPAAARKATSLRPRNFSPGLRKRRA